MKRFWITTWVVALVLLMAGCGQGAGNVPSGSADRTSAAGTTVRTTMEETTTQIPPEQRSTYDPPPQTPKKQAGLFFPQQPKPRGPREHLGPSAVGGGRLFIKNDCTYAGPTQRRYRDEVPSDVVVWPYGYSLIRKCGKVYILNEKGKVVAQIGEEVRMGGGEITQAEAGPTPEAARRQFEEKRGELGVPHQCQGPLWVASGVITQPEK